MKTSNLKIIKWLDAMLNAMLSSYVNYVTAVKHCKVNKQSLLNITVT